MLFSLVLLSALAQPAPETAPSGLAPDQVLAVIDVKGNLTITHVSCNCFGGMNPDNSVTVYEQKGSEKVPVTVKVKVNSLSVTTAEIPARYVEAYTVDGASIPREKLAELLAKERTVLVALDGKKVDPFHLQLYKEGTIVLVPPANVLSAGYGGGFGGGGIETVPVPAPLPPLDLDKKPEPRR